MASAISAKMGLIEEAAVSYGLYGMISMGGEEKEIIEIEVPENSVAEGNSIKDLDLPELCTVRLIRREGKLLSPKGDTVFQKCDKVILEGKTEEMISIIGLVHEYLTHLS